MCKWFYPMNKKTKFKKIHSHLEAVYAIKSNYTAFYPSCYHYKTITKLHPNRGSNIKICELFFEFLHHF